jgi:hypothetical protein
MKELASGFAQFAAIIMLLITLAVSTAAVAQWTSDTPEGPPQQSALATAAAH